MGRLLTVRLGLVKAEKLPFGFRPSFGRSGSSQRLTRRSPDWIFEELSLATAMRSADGIPLTNLVLSNRDQMT